MEILYEDNHLIVIVKPFNLPSQADNSQDPDVVNEVKKYLINKYNKPGNAYVGLVSRLDRPCGGVMILAKTSKAASRLTQSFAQHTDIQKTYLAIIESTNLPDRDSFTDYLLKNTQTNTVKVVSANTPKAKKAFLEYESLRQTNKYTLVKIHLMTGRSHQIRVQFASRNYPLFGDQRYNRNAHPGQQLALWSYSLTIIHPVTKELMTFTANPPSLNPWNQFKEITKEKTL